MAGLPIDGSPVEPSVGPRRTATVIGGTGLLGAQAVVALVDAGYEVTSVSSRSLSLGSWYPAEVKQVELDLFAADTAELANLFIGQDAVVLAAGPDDRMVPQAPARAFFTQRLADTGQRVCQAAVKSGVRRVVVYGSYFTYLNREHPDRRLVDRHPYIGARVDQLNRCLAYDSPECSVAVFEIPYVFGTMPEREPAWLDVLVRRIDRMKPWIFFPRGGTAMCSARYVGEATAAAVTGRVGGPIPIGEQNMDWPTLLSIASEQLYGKPRRVVTIPTGAAALYGWVELAAARARGLEPGLSYGRYIGDVHARESYFPVDLMTSVAEELGVSPEPVTEVVRHTFARCAELQAGDSD